MDGATVVDGAAAAGGVTADGERLAGTDAAFAVQRCREKLREHGARCTAPRIQVMGVLADHVGHLTVGEIHQLLVEAGGRLNISTVYRTVEKLTGLGIVHAVPGRGGEASYGLAGDHHHAVCSRCGAIEEIPGPQLARILAAAVKATAYRVESLIFSGLCPTCRLV
ncbi:Fur family transcriptional regulator [Kitasatospora sp. NPDC052896]|uniref:Fur family transcriptional regulator n=1 Tax=Kitasatospora sp. NPDC052896 TaxID=3364061 RepID=UPI0037CB7EF0